MATPIDDIINPKPEPDGLTEQIVEVLRKAKHQPKPQALTKAEILRACRINWLDVAKPGEGGLLLALTMAYLGHETGIRSELDNLREQALEKLVDSGRVEGREHDGAMHYWLADSETEPSHRVLPGARARQT